MNAAPPWPPCPPVVHSAAVAASAGHPAVPVSAADTAVIAAGVVTAYCATLTPLVDQRAAAAEKSQGGRL